MGIFYLNIDPAPASALEPRRCGRCCGWWRWPNWSPVASGGLTLILIRSRRPSPLRS